MKKFISMVMAAAMVVSLVPATAFAKGDVSATAKIVDKAKLEESDNGVVFDGKEGPELRLKLKEVDAQRTSAGELPTFDVILDLDNAVFNAWTKDIADGDYEEALKKLVSAVDADNKPVEAGTVGSGTTPTEWAVSATEAIGTAADTVGEAVKKYDGISTVSAVDAAIDIEDETKFLSFAALEKEVVPAKTLKDVIDEYVAKGYEHSVAPDGKNLLTKGDKSYVAEDYVTPGKTLAQVIDEKTGFTNYVSYKVTVEGDENDETVTKGWYVKSVKDLDKDHAKFTIAFDPDVVKADWTFIFDLKADMDKYSEGRKAMVSVSGVVDAKDLVYAEVLGEGLQISVRKLVDVAEEEVVTLNDVKIESAVGDLPNKITLKTSKGFEFTKACDGLAGRDYSIEKVDDNELEVTVEDGFDEILIKNIEIEATTAKSGATCTIKATAKGFDSASAEVAKVVDYKVMLTVDEDEDVPVIYSGVNVANKGITDDSEHWSLEVTAEETFPGAWSFRKGFSFELPEGVYVTGVEVTDTDGILKTTSTADDVAKDVKIADVEEAFYEAYQDGDHLNFEFDKRVFDDVDSKLNEDEATMTFKLQLVADPTFEGDVVLKLTGDLVDAQEVTIAKFVKPYTVKAEQNDMKIDYRYTDIPTAITITEAEAGLWEEGAWFEFKVDRGDLIQFEDDATFEIDKDSELEIDDFTGKNHDNKDAAGVIGFEVEDESDEAATVTIKDMSLFMQRNIPAGPYDLTIFSSLEDAFLAQTLFAPDCNDVDCDGDCADKNNDCIVDDVDDYSDVVKAAFVNVITSGRDKDDASFTTKVVVPVGESYIIAGENQVALDVPAYVSAAGYTMLPVRAVAVALGIDTQNVLWNQPTRTVTILYGQRIITMTAGQKVVYVNGSAIPASASVEIVNGRTFLPMRDLATALGVTDITWDAATKTATLNGNQK